jgi:hypothetical protein
MQHENERGHACMVVLFVRKPVDGHGLMVLRMSWKRGESDAVPLGVPRRYSSQRDPPSPPPNRVPLLYMMELIAGHAVTVSSRGGTSEVNCLDHPRD